MMRVLQFDPAPVQLFLEWLTKIITFQKYSSTIENTIVIDWHHLRYQRRSFKVEKTGSGKTNTWKHTQLNLHFTIQKHTKFWILRNFIRLSKTTTQYLGTTSLGFISPLFSFSIKGMYSLSTLLTQKTLFLRVAGT